MNMEDMYDEQMSAKHPFKDIDLAKKKAKQLRWEVINGLDGHLMSFERKFQANGGNVVWAEDTEDAQKALEDIVKEYNITYLNISDSPQVDELGITTLLRSRQGAFCNMKQVPSHAKAELHLCGADFIVASEGVIATSSSNADQLSQLTKTKVNVIVVGIDQVMKDMDDLFYIWNLKARYQSGQKLNTYNSIITGPKKKNDSEGAKRVFVILLDNKRSQLMRNKDQQEILYCIKCDVCKENSCVTDEAISSFKSPLEELIYQYSSDNGYEMMAYPVCEVPIECPVNINVREKLMEIKAEKRQQNPMGFKTKWQWKMWKRMFLDRNKLNGTPHFFKNLMLHLFLTQREELPELPKQSFNERWRSKNPS